MICRIDTFMQVFNLMNINLCTMIYTKCMGQTVLDGKISINQSCRTGTVFCPSKDQKRDIVLSMICC